MGNNREKDIFATLGMYNRGPNPNPNPNPNDEIDVEDEEEEEAVPAHLNPINSSGGFHVVSTDKLSVQYTNSHLHDHDVGVVQANCPAPVKRLAYYFEIFVKNAGHKGQIAIGFTTEHFKMRRQPGWEANSYGYRGDDGLLYRGQGKGESFGPTFTTGDTIGGGINYATQEFFFTKNGKLVGTVYKDVKGNLFPTVAVHSQNEDYFGSDFDGSHFRSTSIHISDGCSGEHTHFRREFWRAYPFPTGVLASIPISDGSSGHHTHFRRCFPSRSSFFGLLPRFRVSVNFGQQSFVFDIEGFVLEERRKQQMMIEKESLPLSLSHSIVRSYLLHYGYQETLNSFDAASKTTLPPIPVVQENGFKEQGETYALNHRKILCQLIRNGDIDSAFNKLQDWYPQLVQNDTSTICFLLQCQKFIELVRVGHLEAAVKYARAELAKFFGDSPLASLLQECIALLAYEEPEKSPVGHLLDMAQREAAADAVNTMVLSTNPSLKDSQSCLHSHLEKLLRQLTVCCLERRVLNGDEGEAFQLRRVLHSSNKQHGKRNASLC